MEQISETGSVLSSKSGYCAWLTFSNPQRHNAVSLHMWHEAASALKALGEDEDVRVLVVTGDGERAFVAGSDMSKFENERASKTDIVHYNDTIERVFSQLANFPMPTVAMIKGHCIGAGLHLALACDIRICSEHASFAMPAAARGLALSYAALRRMVNAIGPASAKELCFTARRFDALEALKFGVVGHVLPHQEVNAFVTNLANQIACNAPLVLRAMKRITTEISSDGVPDRAACADLVDRCFESTDYIEGRRAVSEKRPPNFKGT